jgi:hypothetical protein
VQRLNKRKLTDFLNLLSNIPFSLTLFNILKSMAKQKSTFKPDNKQEYNDDFYSQYNNNSRTTPKRRIKKKTNNDELKYQKWQ